MAQNNEFTIGVKSLSQGKHLFEFHIDKTLFSQFENSYIFDADLNVKIEIEKVGRRTTLKDYSEGYVVVECDRCLEALKLPLSFTAEAEILFDSDEAEESEREILQADAATGELDLAQFVYDYICINVPLRRVHKEGECNEQVERVLRQINGESQSGAEEAESNSPFKELEKLLKKNNN